MGNYVAALKTEKRRNINNVYLLSLFDNNAVLIDS